MKDSFDPFTGLFELIDDPVWSDALYRDEDLTIQFLTKYGNKPVAPLVLYFKEEDKPLTEVQVAKVINMVNRKKRNSWGQLVRVLDIMYKIEDNYNMVETEVIDRDTYESNLRDILRTSEGQSEEVKDLLAKVKRKELDNLRKTGTDSQAGQNTEKSTVSNTGTENRTLAGGSSDELMYDNRKDSERRNLLKSHREDELTTNKNQDTLAFNNRRDSRTLNASEEGSTNQNVDETTIDKKNGEQLDSNFGMDTMNADGRPSKLAKAFNDDLSNREGKTNENRNLTRSEQDALTKTGTESHTQQQDIDRSVESSDLDSGTVDVTKTGSERKVESHNNRDELTLNTSVETDSNVGNRLDTTYNTTDKRDVDGTVDTEQKDTAITTNNDSETTQDQHNMTGTEGVERELKRTGNIGVTTVTKMIQEHIDTWVDFDFLDIVFKDIADELTLPIYQGGR